MDLMNQLPLSNNPDPNRRVREAEHPRSPLVRFESDRPLSLDAGVLLTPFQVAYQTYGTLNADRSNAVLASSQLAQQIAEAARRRTESRSMAV